MTTTPPDLKNDLEQLKQRMKATWMAGDFGRIAVHNAKEGAKFIARLQPRIGPGTKVLDVACGTGNLAIPAARAGAKVTGVDIATNLIEQARKRAAEEGVTALTTFDEGDAEQLPYADAQFDVVVTMFGAMFAPRPERTAEELLRVCRPGGLIAMANWTPEGFVGKMFAINARHVAPPAGVPAPVLWGKEDVVRERFGKGASKVEVHRILTEFDYPYSPADTVEFFRTYFGPAQVAFSKLDSAGQKALADDLTRLWSENNRGTADHTVIDAEYLQVYVTRV